MRFIRFFSLDANSAFLRSPSMMKAVIVDAKNTMLPVPNTSSTIVNAARVLDLVHALQRPRHNRRS